MSDLPEYPYMCKLRTGWSRDAVEYFNELHDKGLACCDKVYSSHYVLYFKNSEDMLWFMLKIQTL